MKRGIWALAAMGVVGLILQAVFADDGFEQLINRSRSNEPQTRPERPEYFSRSGDDAAPSESRSYSRSFAPREQSPAASSDQPNRYVRNQSSAASPAAPKTSPLKNYHQALFGDEAPTGQLTASEQQSIPRNDKELVQQPYQSDVRSPVSQVGYEQQEPIATPPSIATARSFPPIRSTAPTAAPTTQSRYAELMKSASPQNAGELPPMPLRHAQFAESADRQRGIVHAEFRNETSPNSAATIQQIRATSEQVEPFTRDVIESPVESEIKPQEAPALNDDSQHNSRLTILKGEEKIAPQSEPTPSYQVLRAEPVFSETSASSEIPAVQVTWKKRSDLNVGQECQFELLVKNTSPFPAANVDVNSYFPATVRLTDAKPEPAANQDYLSWHFDMLAAGEEQRIAISLIPSARGNLGMRAEVTFTGLAASQFVVEEPLLQVVLEGPETSRVGEPASQLITVSNPGTGNAEDVVVGVLLPRGLEHPRGEQLTMDVGSLNPGESRKIRLTLLAVEGGPHEIQVEAKATAGLHQVATKTVEVKAPSLVVAIDGPSLRYVGRTAHYAVRVLNDGNSVTNNVRVHYSVPKGFEFLQTENGGKFESADKTISWFVGRIEPGQIVDLGVTLKAVALGDFTHHAQAVSEHSPEALAEAVTRVDGTASLAMEIVDLDDPVEVGVETAFEIRVQNEGTKEAGNVAVSCEVPAGVELLSAKGPAEFRLDNGILIFQAFDALPPGKTALYRVHLRGISAGNHRYRARLTSDSIQEPLVSEELTKFYAD